MDINHIISTVDSYAEKKKLDPICKIILREFFVRSYEQKIYSDVYLTGKLNNLDRELTAMKMVFHKNPTDYLGYHMYNEVYLCGTSIKNVAINKHDEATQTVIAGFHELSHNMDISLKMDRKIANDVHRGGYERWLINTLDDEVNTIIASFILMYKTKSIDELQQQMVMNDINKQCISAIKVVDSFCKSLNINFAQYIRGVKAGEESFQKEMSDSYGNIDINRFFLLKKLLIYYTTRLEAIAYTMNDETKANKVRLRASQNYQKMLPLYQESLNEFNQISAMLNQINIKSVHNVIESYDNNKLIDEVMKLITERDIAKSNQKTRYVLLRKLFHRHTDREKLISDLKNYKNDLLSQKDDEPKVTK